MTRRETFANIVADGNCEDRSLQSIFDQIPLIVTVMDGDIEDPYPTLFHSATEIQFVSEGECSYFVSDSVWHCTRNSILIIHGNEIHNRLSGSCKSLKRFTIIINNTLLETNPAIKDLIDDMRDVRQIDLPNKKAILGRILMEEILEEMEQHNPFWQDAAIACII